LLGACSTAEPTAPVRLDPQPPAAERSALEATGRALIPEGSFNAGTEAGELNRQPELEPRIERVALGSFEIDVAPYPGGSGPAIRGMSRADAREACGQRGGRLCTELEWERACKGPESLAFPQGAQSDQGCTQDGSCVSGFGVRGMGSLREWTQSDLAGGGEPRAVVRGASPGGPPELQRCAHRSSAPALGTEPEIGFRCCYGPVNAARVSRPVLGATFRRVELPLAELSRILATDPRTAELATDLAYFQEPDAVATVLGRGPGKTQGFLLSTVPLRWNPVLGSEFLVVSARSGTSSSFVVAYHVLAEGKYRLASSFVMRDEPGPIALAYNGHIRPRLHFSSCWGCAGETGKILYRDPDSVIILQP
jgi:hypothetical protein